MLASVVLGTAISLAPGKSWKSEPFPLTGGVQYRVDMRAHIVGETTIEENAQVGEAFYDVARPARGMKLPRWSFVFKTADGRDTGLGVLFPYWQVFYSGAWHTYVDAFNAPWDAATVRIVYRNDSPRDTLVVEEPVLSETKFPYVNVNPDFAFGERCHAGFGLGGYGSHVRIEKRPNGSGFYLSVKSWTTADRLPVRSGHAYAFDLKLMPGTKVGSNCSVSFFDAGGNGLKGPGIGGSFLVKGKDGFAVTTYVAPPNAAYMGLHISQKTDFEHIRIKDLGVEQ